MFKKALFALALIGGLGLAINGMKKNGVFESAADKCMKAKDQDGPQSKDIEQQIMQACASAVEADPSNLEARYLLALAEYRLGDRAAGRRHLEENVSQDHAPSAATLAFADQSPERLDSARALFLKQADQGDKEALMSYAELSLYNADGKLRSASAMHADGTFRTLDKIAQDGNGRMLFDLGYRFYRPRKGADTEENNNITYVSDTLFEIASHAGDPDATTILAYKAVYWSQRYSSANMSNEAASSLDEAATLARQAIKQAGGRHQRAAHLLDEIEKIQTRGQRFWLGMLAMLLSPNSGGSQQGEARDPQKEVEDMQHESRCQQLRVNRATSTWEGEAAMIDGSLALEGC